MSQTTAQWLRALPGTRLGKYEVRSYLDRGGMAAVFTAWHPDLQQEVILKILLPTYAQDPTIVKRFQQEAHAASRLTHPNIIRIADAGQAGGNYYIAMEYVRGGSLKDLLDRQPGQALDIRWVQSIVDQVTSALDYAHRQGVVHRDVKPSNILIAEDGRVVLTDFGIALARQATRLTAAHMAVGTPDYMSPEQAKGDDVDKQTDIYSLGIVLYEMLAGRPPYRANTPWAVVHKHIYEPLPPLRGVAPPIVEVVQRAVHKDPTQRFASAGELAHALRQAMGGIAPPPRPHARIWILVAAALAAVLLIAGALAIRILIDSNGTARVAAATTGVAEIASRAVTSTPARVQKVTPSQTAALPPTATETPVRPTDTPTPRPTPTGTPTPTSTPAATATPWIVIVTARPTDTSTPTSTPAPSSTPAATKPRPTAAPTAKPTQIPTPVPQASPLTGRIAFSAVEGGTGKHILYSINPDGTELRWLGDHLRQPSIRQDGQMIVANGQGGSMNDLWRLKPDGSKIASMGFLDDEHPVWLQSKSYHVGFDSLRWGNGKWHIYLGDDPVLHGSGPILGRFPVWLPGESIAYKGCDDGFGSGAKCGVFRVPMWGGIPTQLTSDPNDIPTGGGEAGVLFMRQVEGNWDIHLVAPGGGSAQRLTEHPGNDGLATFSPDGKTIAFLSDRSGAWAIWLMNRHGANQRKVYDLPFGGGYGSAWQEERLSWGPLPTAPTPTPTAADAHLFPAPQIDFPIPEDTVSSTRPATVRWSWSGTLAANQGFQVRFWHANDPAPNGVSAPITDRELVVNYGLTDTYLTHGEGFYSLDVVVVQVEPHKVLSRSSPIQVKTDPNKR